MTRTHAVSIVARTASLVLVSLWAAPSVLGQVVSDGELIFGAQRKLAPFSLETPHGYIDVNGQYSDDRISSKNGDKTESSQKLTEETLSLSTTGYIIHPNLLDLSLGGSFSLTQEWLNDNQGTSQSNGTLYSWDASATLLRQQMVPLTLYTNRSTSLVNQSFGPTLNETDTTYGAYTHIRDKNLPTDLRIYRNEQDQSSSLSNDATDFQLTSDVFEWHTQAQPTLNQAFSWDYHFERDEQTGASGISGNSQSQSAALGHSINFGPANGYSLASSLTYTESTGLFDTRRVRLDELLRLRHTKQFETDYEYSVDRPSAFGLDQTEQRATAGFRHELYQSLITSGRVGWTGLDFSDGSSSRDISGNLTTDYRKKIPYGTFHADAGVDYDAQNNSSRNETSEVIDQSFSFVNFQPFPVNQRGIVPTSVIIRDSTGHIFTPGLDYTIQPNGEGLQVNRVIGGSIPDNDPLLLSYDIAALPSNDITTTGYNLGTRYDIEQGLLKGVSPYAYYRESSQSISGGGGEVLPDNIHDYVVGIEYRLGDLLLRGEHEKYDSSLFPYDANRASLRLDHRLSLDTTVEVNVDYTSTNYPKQPDRTDSTLIGANITRQLARGLIANLAASWINVEDQLSGHTQGFQEFFELQYNYRKTEFYARVRNSSLDSDAQDTNFLYVQIGVRRHF